MIYLLIFLTANALAVTVPISVRLSFALGDWIDAKIEDVQRSRQ